MCIINAVQSFVLDDSRFVCHGQRILLLIGMVWHSSGELLKEVCSECGQVCEPQSLCVVSAPPAGDGGSDSWVFSARWSAGLGSQPAEGGSILPLEAGS